MLQVKEKGRQFSGMCPICQKKRRIETVLSVSGYAFCYKCIMAHLSKNNRCPVTNNPATVDNLIRIYPPE